MQQRLASLKDAVAAAQRVAAAREAAAAAAIQRNAAETAAELQRQDVDKQISQSEQEAKVVSPTCRCLLALCVYARTALHGFHVSFPPRFRYETS